MDPRQQISNVINLFKENGLININIYDSVSVYQNRVGDCTIDGIFDQLYPTRFNTLGILSPPSINCYLYVCPKTSTLKRKRIITTAEGKQVVGVKYVRVLLTFSVQGGVIIATSLVAAPGRMELDTFVDIADQTVLVRLKTFIQNLVQETDDHTVILNPIAIKKF